MATELISNLTWVLIELESKNPKTNEVKKVLDKALSEAIRLATNYDVSRLNLIRLAQAGGY